MSFDSAVTSALTKIVDKLTAKNVTLVSFVFCVSGVLVLRYVQYPYTPENYVQMIVILSGVSVITIPLWKMGMRHVQKFLSIRAEFNLKFDELNKMTFGQILILSFFILENRVRLKVPDYFETDIKDMLLKAVIRREFYKVDDAIDIAVLPDWFHFLFENRSLLAARLMDLQVRQSDIIRYYRLDDNQFRAIVKELVER